MRMATLQSLVIFWYWLALSCYHLSAQHLQMKDRKFYKMADSSLVGNVTVTMKAGDAIECSFLCLQSAPSLCLSFNFGGTLVESHYTCELSNSERLLEPQKMQQRALFDYYGTNVEHLTTLYPCVAIPCRFNAKCLPGPNLGEYSCECGLEIAALPFTENNCNVDISLATAHVSTENVFHAKVGSYQLNFYEAQRLCEMYGATLASYAQLYAAWEAGMQVCAYGWLQDSTFRFPMQTSSSGCGSRGIVGSSTPQAKSKKKNAWCYKN